MQNTWFFQSLFSHSSFSPALLKTFFSVPTGETQLLWACLPTKTSPQLPPPAPELPPESYEKSSSLVPLASPWRSPHFSLTACTFRRVLLSTSGKLEQSIAGNYLYFLNRTNTSSFLLLFGHFSRDFVAVSNLSHQHVPNMNDTQIGQNHFGKLPLGHHLRGDR